MNAETEDRLARLTPRGAPPELRHRVLAAVARELARSSEALHTIDHTPPVPPSWVRGGALTTPPTPPLQGGESDACASILPPLQRGGQGGWSWQDEPALAVPLAKGGDRGNITRSGCPPGGNGLRARPSLFLGLVASAAAVLAGLALNVWVNAELDRRLASVLGPPPVSEQIAQIAAEIADVTNSAVGQWAYQRLAVVERHGDDAYQYASRLQRMIQQLTFDSGETVHEAPQEDSRMDRNRHGSRDRHPAADQRLLRLEHRNTA